MYKTVFEKPVRLAWGIVEFIVLIIAITRYKIKNKLLLFNVNFAPFFKNIVKTYKTPTAHKIGAVAEFPRNNEQTHAKQIKTNISCSIFARTNEFFVKNSHFSCIFDKILFIKSNILLSVRIFVCYCS